MQHLLWPSLKHLHATNHKSAWQLLDLSTSAVDITGRKMNGFHMLTVLCVWFCSLFSPDGHQAVGDWPAGFPDHHDEDWSYQTLPVHRLPAQVQLLHMLSTSHHMRMTHISHSELSSLQRSLFSVATWGCSQQTGRCFGGGETYCTYCLYFCPVPHW